MTWLMEILGIYLEDKLVIKYYVINYLNVAKNSKYDGYQRDLLLIIYKCF